MHGVMALVIATAAGVAAGAAHGEYHANHARIESMASDGRFISGVFRNESGERSYKLYLPDATTPDGGRAMVVFLHGCTQDADDLARGSRMNAAAERRGWLVLYPEQSARYHATKCWAWYDPAHQVAGAGEPAIIAGMTAQIAAEHHVDPARIFLAGVSAGGAMASLVAAAYPRQFAALALHSALVYRAARTMPDALGVMQRGVSSPEPHAEEAFAAMGDAARVVPALVIHGGADAVVAPINGAQAARQWFLTNALSIGQPLDTTSGATDRRERSEGGYTVTQSAYRAKNGLVLSELVMVRELGHAWSGGATEGSYTDPRGPDATALVVDFFVRHQPR